MADLAELFQKSNGKPVQIGEDVVYAIWRMSLAEPSRLRLMKVQASKEPVPGVRLKVYDGTLIIDGETLKDSVLWSDTALSEVKISVTPKKGKIAELRIWNCWRDRGIMQAWLVNAGMLIEQSGTTVCLRCNSGPTPLTSPLAFDDLVITLDVIPVEQP